MLTHTPIGPAAVGILAANLARGNRGSADRRAIRERLPITTNWFGISADEKLIVLVVNFRGAGGKRSRFTHPFEKESPAMEVVGLLCIGAKQQRLYRNSDYT